MTAIGSLLRYHNLNHPYRRYTRAQLLVGMCMDHRKSLRIPDNFAYVLRAGGANFRRIEFKVSFAIAVGGVGTVALIGHDQCGMASLLSRREAFITGLVERGGWTPIEAEAHFEKYAPEFSVPRGPRFVWSEAKRLKQRYPLVQVAALYYLLREKALYQIVAAND
jgi:carbonic anhydrase